MIIIILIIIIIIIIIIIKITIIIINKFIPTKLHINYENKIMKIR